MFKLCQKTIENNVFNLPSVILLYKLYLASVSMSLCTIRFGTINMA